MMSTERVAGALTTALTVAILGAGCFDPAPGYTEFQIFNDASSKVVVPVFHETDHPAVVRRDGTKIPIGAPNCLKRCSDLSPVVVQCAVAAPFTEIPAGEMLSLSWDGLEHSVGRDVYGNECQSVRGMNTSEALTVRICVHELSPNSQETGRKGCTEEAFTHQENVDPQSSQVVEIRLTDDDLS
jgi:hypothetical protein